MNEKTESVSRETVERHYGWLHIPDRHIGEDRPAWVSAVDAIKLEQELAALIAENDRLRMAERVNVETVAALQKERDALQLQVYALTNANKSLAEPPNATHFGFVEAMNVADCVFEKYREDHPKWWKRMDGTPILNDVAVRMAQAYLEATQRERSR